MQCIYCGNDIAKVTNTRMVGIRVLRRRKCPACKKSFVTEELGYVADEKKGSDIAHDIQVAEYEIMKKRTLGISNRKLVTTSKPVKKRKVTPTPKPVKEGEVYLTYGEIISIFRKKIEGAEQHVIDYRPYPLLDYSIIVWFKNGAEVAYQYHPKQDVFIQIENAKTYEEILNEKARK